MPLTKYNVKVTFNHPAWDEKDGFVVTTYARTKADANSKVRRQMADAGHRDITLRAIPVPEEPTFDPLLECARLDNEFSGTEY